MTPLQSELDLSQMEGVSMNYILVISIDAKKDFTAFVRKTPKTRKCFTKRKAVSKRKTSE